MPTQPLRVFLTLFWSKPTFFACRACSTEINLSSAIRLSTTSRRSSAALGLRTGLLVSGFCTSPASIAACANVSLLALLEK